MSITNGVRHRVQRVRLGYGGDHIARVPEHVARERDARLAAAADQDAVSVLLGEPPPGRSALDAHRLRQAEREARPRISISAAPVSKAVTNSVSAQAAAECRRIARGREPEPVPELVRPALEPAPEPTPKPDAARKLPECYHCRDDAPASCACFHNGATYWFGGELRRDPRCVVALLAQGYDQAKIATRLVISPRLVGRLARMVTA
jgi:hypothetical protein